MIFQHKSLRTNMTHGTEYRGSCLFQTVDNLCCLYFRQYTKQNIFLYMTISYAGFDLMRLSGAEGNRTPVRTYIQCTSTVIADVLSFPPDNAHQQALSFSSFINFLLPQSFGNRVFRKGDTGYPCRGKQEPVGCA